MHFPLGARGNNFDSQIKIISSWSKRIPFASSGLLCGCIRDLPSLDLRSSFIHLIIREIYYNTHLPPAVKTYLD